jgi:cystathionine gamma-synthase
MNGKRSGRVLVSGAGIGASPATPVDQAAAAGASSASSARSSGRQAASLGGVESLIEHRASVEGPASPVPADLLRLSVGIEDTADLIEDLEQALAGE